MAGRRQRRRALRTNSKTWLRIRKQVLMREPCCVACLAAGRIEPANEVDHIDGDTANNTWENLQGLCKPCHSSKTAREMNEKGGLSAG